MIDIRVKKSVSNFIADRWAFGDEEVVEVNAKELAEVLIILENSQRALLKANRDIEFLKCLSHNRTNYTVDLKSLYA